MTRSRAGRPGGGGAFAHNLRASDGRTIGPVVKRSSRGQFAGRLLERHVPAVHDAREQAVREPGCDVELDDGGLEAQGAGRQEDSS